MTALFLSWYYRIKWGLNYRSRERVTSALLDGSRELLFFIASKQMDSWKTIILAAGKGTRMNSKVPKVLQPLCGREMVGLVADALRSTGLQELVAIVPPGTPEIGSVIGTPHSVVEQSEALGTGHALLQARGILDGYQGNILVINGDMPLITPETLSAIIRYHESNQCHVSLLTSDPVSSEGMGRVLRDDKENVIAIAEERDLEGEGAVPPEGNVGVYCFKAPWLWSVLEEVTPSSKGEIYITGLIALAASQGYRIGTVALKDSLEGMGVNDGVQLATAREAMQRRINREWLLKGVTLIEPAYIDIGVELEPDASVYPNTFLHGKTRIGQGCHIGPGSIVVDSSIAGGCRVLHSVIEGAVLEEGVEIGPYSHIRPESHIERDVHIGNFAEIKKSRLGSNTKMGHFSYVGDAQVGANVNIGAGAITCNFDGVNKNQTVIEDGAFIGSDSMLVAPVRIGAGASTGAGSVVTREVPAGALVVGAPARIVSSTASQREGI